MDERMQESVSADLSQTDNPPAQEMNMPPTEPPRGRRDFLKTVGTLGVAGATVTAIGAGGYLAGSTPEEKTGKHLAMVIDLRRCTGCRSCAVACKAENGVRLGGFRSWVSDLETGEYPKVKRRFLPRLCNHCQNASCLKVCPPGATYKRADGLVAIDKSKCIGCKHCMGACPYSVRYFNPGHDPEGEQRFPALTYGTVDKCTFCDHRVDNGMVPSCVNTCPAKARIFGDLNDPDSDVARLCADEVVVSLLPEFGTKPSVFYLGGDPRSFAEPSA